MMFGIAAGLLKPLNLEYILTVMRFLVFVYGHYVKSLLLDDSVCRVVQ